MCGINVSSSKSAKAREDEYRAEEDHRSLTRAEEIRADVKRMAGVKRHHQKQTRALKRMSRVVGARAAR